MPNTIVPANATGLPDVSYDRSAIMRKAVAHARQMIEREREHYQRRWSAEIRYGGKRPAMKLPTWRAAMSEGLRFAWADAKKVRKPAPIAPAISAELAKVELRILSIHAAERVTRDESAMLPTLHARAAELSRAAMAHIHH
ncbi:hypothetical protein EV667_0228 [Ancylobacter aquaticus]|uniref:Uncharacterized protein n=1 Tax=Ancylobacter aquaticus TaxID=100 RepID=A0A4R1I7N1_ANCAQ|nr:hypothetical protein [Ancylobacter aquaticus]TCK30141.1 hypothetical protein EV667_0228 [Ancylobacter aquaticus]